MRVNNGWWSHANLRRLWSARTISGLGSELTYLALPLLAATTLQATPVQMGVLTAAGTLPNLLLALWIGVLVDRTQRRRLMIVADIARALVVGTVALAALFGIARLDHLIVAAFFGSALGLVGSIADNAMLPALLRPDQRAEGNASIALGSALTEGIGPGLASILVQFVAAPVLLLVDAASFVASALLVRRIDVHEIPSTAPPSSVLADLRAGFRFVWRQPVLRATLANGVVLQLTGGASDALTLLFITRTLGLPVTVIGMSFAAGAVTALVAGLLAARIIRRYGLGRAASIGALLISIAGIWFSRATGAPAFIIVVILASGLIGSFGNTLYNIAVATLVQTVTPQRMLGRVGAVEVVIAGGALPVGALVGGVLASMLDIRTTLFLVAVVRVPLILALLVWLWRVDPKQHTTPNGTVADSE